MNEYKLIAGLCAPSEDSYQDEETIRDYDWIVDAWANGANERAIELLLKYTSDWFDTTSWFDSEEDYVADADLDGVYLYKKL